MIEQELGQTPTTQASRRFVVAGDERHTVVVEHTLPAGMTNDPAACLAWEQQALQLAGQRFAAHGVAHGDLQVQGIWDGEDHLDEFEQLGIPEAGLIAMAQQRYNDEDLTVDGNAVLSGLNIQIWQYMEPLEVMEYFTRNGPMSNVRDCPSMLDERSAPAEQDLARMRDALVACRRAFDRLANGESFNAVVEATGCTAAATAALSTAERLENHALKTADTAALVRQLRDRGVVVAVWSAEDVPDDVTDDPQAWLEEHRRDIENACVAAGNELIEERARVGRALQPR